MNRNSLILQLITLRFKYFIVFLFILSGSASLGQGFKLRINVNVPATHEIDSIYLAGNFNGWDPGRKDYQLIKENSGYYIELKGLKEGMYQFKFTRGDWSKVEVNSTGSGVDNKIVKLISDSIISYRVGGWQDDFPVSPKQHTISPQVKIIDTAFFMPQLNRTARIWIYLPEGYKGNKNKKRYPVLYMQDGQNLFDEYTAANGEWGIDECLDSMIRNGSPESIIVGIDNGPRRINEYNPFDSEEYGKSEAEQYLAFLTESLKPFIDEHYSTLPGSENTMIAGSSMGALLSYYALLTQPAVFGKAGVFSPSFWIAPEIKQLTDSIGDQVSGKIFFYIGELEGQKHLELFKQVADNMGKNSNAIIYAVIDPEGRHNEQSWRKWFPEFYGWMMGKGFNNQVKIDK